MVKDKDVKVEGELYVGRGSRVDSFDDLPELSRPDQSVLPAVDNRCLVPIDFEQSAVEHHLSSLYAVLDVLIQVKQAAFVH